MYTHGHTVKNARKLPLNLLDALRAFEKSAILKAAFGAEFMTAYKTLKLDEWDQFNRHLSQWERIHTLDC